MTEGKHREKGIVVVEQDDIQVLEEEIFIEMLILYPLLKHLKIRFYFENLVLQSPKFTFRNSLKIQFCFHLHLKEKLLNARSEIEHLTGLSEICVECSTGNKDLTF